MRRTFTIAAFIAALSAVPSASLEIENIIGLGNVAFDPSDEASLEAAGAAFEPNLYGFGSLAVSDRLSEIIDFRVGFERGPVLRNTLFTQIGFNSDYVRLAVGPFFGPFNAEGSVLSAGISAGLRLEVPGIVFATFSADSTIGAGLSAPGDNVQERTELSVGFWAPNTIVAFRISSQTFTLRDSRSLDIQDEATRYELLADVYKKNVPYTASVDIGYQSLSRGYIGQLDTAEDKLDSVIVGFELSVNTSKTLRLMTGAEAALFSWGADDLGSPSPTTALFSARIGVAVTLPNVGYAARHVGTEPL